MKAFPTPTFSINNEARVTSVGGDGGMDLRDYFAAKVMQGFAARDVFDSGLASPEQRARLAYVDADAMMKARQS